MSTTAERAGVDRVVPCRACEGTGEVTEHIPMYAFYFGTYGEAGHYFWDRQGKRLPYGEPVGPWGHIDGKLTPEGDREGEALLHHHKGWTAIAFANRTDDSRPQSNSAFLFGAVLTFDEAVEEARKTFPWVTDRLAFEFVEVDRYGHRVTSALPPMEGPAS